SPPRSPRRGPRRAGSRRRPPRGRRNRAEGARRMSLAPEPRRGAAAPEPPGSEELPRMTLLEHLEELRQRLIRSVLALAIGVGVCFSWAPEICRFLAAPIYR